MALLFPALSNQAHTLGKAISFLSITKNQALSGFRLTSYPNTALFNNDLNNQSTRHSSKAAALAKSRQNAARPLVIFGPSGAGKTTIIKEVTKGFPDCFGLCVSHTTRKPRAREIDGENYHFIPRDVFKDMKDRGEFIETLDYIGNMYGLSKEDIGKRQAAGVICVLETEYKGVHQIKNTPGLDPHFVFIMPPSIEELERRLRGRKTETEESIKIRLEKAEKEIKQGSKASKFDLVIINDKLDEAASKLRDYLMVHIEDLKRIRRLSLENQPAIATKYNQ